MFVNFSNHESSLWPSAQIKAAKEFGEIIDIPFPPIPSESTADEVNAVADEYSERIQKMGPAAVMCQGEFTLAYAVVSKLKTCGMTVVAACSERRTVERVVNGVTQKSTVFEFKQFREYRG